MVAEKVIPFSNKILVRSLLLFSFFVGSLVSSADEKNVTVTPHGSWKVENGVYLRQNQGKDTSFIQAVAKIKPQEYYRLTFQGKISTGKPVELGIGINRRQWEGVHLNCDWTAFQCNIYAAKSEDIIAAQFYCHDPEPRTISIKDIKIEELTEAQLAENLLAVNLGAWRISRHKPGAPYDLSFGKDDSSITGNSMKFRAGDYIALSSISFPVTPGKKYRFELWAKASRRTTLGLLFSCGKYQGKWFTPGEHELATEEWRKFSADMTMPEDFEPGHLVSLYLDTLGIFPDLTATMYFSDISFKCINSK